MTRENGHPFCISKPQKANTRRQRDLLFTKKVLFIFMCIKFDGIQVLAKPDKNGVYQFSFPKSRKRVPFDEHVLLKLREEMRACRGVVIFELYCFRARFHEHNFYGTSGVPVRKTNISLADIESKCLTMVATHTEHGADCQERCEHIRSWFAPGHVPIREDGSFAWPEGPDKPLVTVFDFKKIKNVDVEFRLREIKAELSKINSPSIEGLVAYMLYGPGDAERNAFPAWGEAGPYESLHYFAKIKAQDVVRTVCTAVHGSNPTPGHPAQTWALLAHPLPDPKTGKPRTALSIPLDTEMLTELKMALKYQTNVWVLCAHIDWYWNTDRGPPGGVPSDMRFFVVIQVRFDPHNMHDLRPAGDVFAILRPKAQAIKAAGDERAEEPPRMSAVAEAAAAWAACKVAKTTAKAREKRAEKTLEQKEGHRDYNPKTGKWYTAKEQVKADRSHKNCMSFFDGVANAFKEATAEMDAEGESYRAPKQPTQKEQAALESEKSLVRAMITRCDDQHQYVDQTLRDTLTKRAAESGLVVGVDLMWPVVALKSFVNEAWKATWRTDAQEKALRDEQDAVKRLVRRADFRGEYFSRDLREDMVRRGENCGLRIDNSMWPFLSLATAKKKEIAYMKLDVSLKKDLPVLSAELTQKWLPRAASAAASSKQPARPAAKRAEKRPLSVFEHDPTASDLVGKLDREMEHPTRPAVPAVEVDFERECEGGGQAASRARSPSPDAPSGEDKMERWLRTGKYERS